MTGEVAAGEQGVEQAVQLLREGWLVAIPTETVYGLAADARSDDAVARIFEVKGRPKFNPLICHVHDIAVLEDDILVDGRAQRLIDAFWPGPLTLVLPRRPSARISLLASAGLDTLAVRTPRHPVALKILETMGGPLVAPSANRSGRISPTQAVHVQNDLGSDVSLVLDGGPCTVGVESTVLDLSSAEPRVLRPGAIVREQIERAIGPIESGAQNDGPLKSPGLLSSHYAPSKALRLNATAVAPGEALLAFGPEAPKGAALVLNLSRSANLREAAANLFSMLRELDRSEANSIAAMPIPGEGLGEAIRDRLKRAAARG